LPDIGTGKTVTRRAMVEQFSGNGRIRNREGFRRHGQQCREQWRLLDMRNDHFKSEIVSEKVTQVTNYEYYYKVK
jgi:hypothetical protein